MLVKTMAPVVHVRVARELRRRRPPGERKSRREDVEDLTQEVFASLFNQGGKALRAWDPSRGLDFLGFVGFLSERAVAMQLRSAKRNPWTEDPTEPQVVEQVANRGRSDTPVRQLESRDMLSAVLSELRAWLTPDGQRYFQLLYVDERPIVEVAREEGTTADALYAWRSRLLKKTRAIRERLQSEHEDGE